MRQIGGFASLNSGTISDCYSAVKISGSGPISGLCAENKGELVRCLFRGGIHNKKSDKAGTILDNLGIANNIFWLCKGTPAKEYKDADAAVSRSELKKNKTPDAFAPFLETDRWTLVKNKNNLELLACESPCRSSNYHARVEITTREDLKTFARSVNEGKATKGLLFVLTNDIDLAGEEWTPIGVDTETPFEGHFDGAGHTIKNFRINPYKNRYAGFFGVIGKQGTVSNLTVDGIMEGKGTYAGAFCAYNFGLITHCVTRFKVSNSSSHVGAFVCRNNGTITCCCSHGCIGPAAPLWWLSVIALLAAGLAVFLAFYLTVPTDPSPDDFTPIIIEPDSKPIEDEIPKPEEDEISQSNATFIMNADMTIDTATHVGNIGLKNPSWSNRGFVATIRISKECLATFGIESSDDFTTLYKSGLIKPGFGVEFIKLNSLPNDINLPAGEYELSVKFEFYNPDTHEKSPIDANAPLKIKVN